MRAPGFWSKPPSHPAALLLRPVALAYGALTASRMDRAGTRAPCPVICVGNFTLGGAGKTPTAIAIASMLTAMGKRPAFLSRGYGGGLPGPVLVEPGRHRFGEVGDEPLLLARHAPTVVARDRTAGALLCAEAGADVIVMDDGLQNPSLEKDFALAVVDAGSGIGNGLTFPAGPLRVPLARQWRHVQGIVLIGDGMPGEQVARAATERGLPVHRARLVPEGADRFCGRRVLAFAGIGRPEKFFDSLRQVGAEVAATRAFPDHHAFAEAELVALVREAEKNDAVLVTTEKDLVRLPSGFAKQVAIMPVSLRFDAEAAFVDGVRRALAR